MIAALIPLALGGFFVVAFLAGRRYERNLRAAKDLAALPPPEALATELAPYRPLVNVVYDGSAHVRPLEVPKGDLFPVHFVRGVVDRVDHRESIKGSHYVSWVHSDSDTFSFHRKLIVGEKVIIAVCRMGRKIGVESTLIGEKVVG